MKVALGSDHAGYEPPEPLYKPAMAEWLCSKGYEVVDLGCHGPEPVDYPDVARAVAKSVASGECARGVLICGTGIGMAIAANRIPGVRAAACVTEQMARLAREHNDANLLCLGRRLVTIDECRRIAEVWLTAETSDLERHRRRVEKMG
jgi:ribose 5-phosphate isomerase B